MFRRSGCSVCFDTNSYKIGIPPDRIIILTDGLIRAIDSTRQVSRHATRRPEGAHPRVFEPHPKNDKEIDMKIKTQLRCGPGAPPVIRDVVSGGG
jgi:hypothetical protein